MYENVIEENEHFHNVSIVDQLQNISMEITCEGIKDFRISHQGCHA